MTEFMRPQVTVDRIDDRVARYVVEPLERGFGYTLGNCMRRVLLSSLQGAAATSIRVEGQQHEFASIEGVREDVTDIVLNVKGLVFRETGIGAGDAVATLSVTGPAVVTGADLKVPAEFELVNPEHVIAHAEQGCEARDGHSHRRRPRLRLGRPQQAAGGSDRRHHRRLAVLARSSRCTYVVENTRVGQRTDYDKLTLEVETNGSIDPERRCRSCRPDHRRAHDALRRAGRARRCRTRASSPPPSTRARAFSTRRSRSSTFRSARTTA